MNGTTPQQRRNALGAIRDAIRPFHDGTGVRLGASVLVTSTMEGGSVRVGCVANGH